MELYLPQEKSTALLRYHFWQPATSAQASQITHHISPLHQSLWASLGLSPFHMGSGGGWVCTIIYCAESFLQAHIPCLKSGRLDLLELFRDPSPICNMCTVITED